jgi:hypothetical protein
MVTDKLKSYAAAHAAMGLRIERRQHKGLNNRAENSHKPTRRRERIMKRFKSARQEQKFLSIHDQIANLFHHAYPERRSAAIRRVMAFELVALEQRSPEPTFERCAKCSQFFARSSDCAERPALSNLGATDNPEKPARRADLAGEELDQRRRRLVFEP